MVNLNRLIMSFLMRHEAKVAARFIRFCVTRFGTVTIPDWASSLLGNASDLFTLSSHSSTLFRLNLSRLPKHLVLRNPSLLTLSHFGHLWTTEIYIKFTLHIF